MGGQPVRRSDGRVARQVGRALHRLRLERDFAQKVVASRAGITRPMLSHYEHGHQQPTLGTLVKILRVLDCSAEDFGKRLGPWGCLS
jgi:transcriptional regulator with XRE-family HTH domain